MKGKPSRWLRVAKFVAYPSFYVLCLAFFGYLSFPWAQLKDRVVAEFNKSQRKSLRRPGDKPMRLEIDELDSYWFTGIEITGARLIIPPKPPTKKRAGLAGFGGDDEKAPPAKDSIIRLSALTARVQLLSLLTGDIVIGFTAEAFGGEIEGTVPIGVTGDAVEIEFAGLQLLEVGPLQSMLEGVPLQGIATGTVKLKPKEGKFAKADGNVAIAISDVKLGKPTKNDEGKLEDVVEIEGIKVPSVMLGTLNFEMSAKDGGLKLADLSAKSADFELLGEGTIKLNEVWDRSRAEMFLKFKFTDAYRTKSPAATSLLGKPGDKSPLIELGSPKLKRSKTEDGFYRFRIHGPLANLTFDSAGAAPGRSSRTKPRNRAKRARKSAAARRGVKAEGDGDEPGEPTPKRRPRARPKLRPRTPPPAPEPTADDAPAPPSDAPAEDVPTEPAD